MDFENRFEVDAPLDKVWETLLDVERVAPAMPGAEVLERSGDDAYKVGIKVKVGPVSMQYKGDVEIIERDVAAHRAVMRASAKETRGQGTANADVEMQLAGNGSKTSATITTRLHIRGKAAAMGQGVMQDVAGKLVETFATNLGTMLAAEAPAPQPAAPGAPDAGAPPPEAPRPAPQELSALSLAGSVAADRLRERRVAVTIGIVVLVWLVARALRRR